MRLLIFRSVIVCRWFQVLERIILDSICIVHFLGIAIETERVSCRHLTGLRSVIDLFDDAPFVDLDTAERAELQVGVVGVVRDEVLVTLVVELMGLVARQLSDLLAQRHLQEANTALTGLLDAERGINCSTKTVLGALDD